MNIERMQPADFDAVYRLLTQSFPATERRGAAGVGDAASGALGCTQKPIGCFIKTPPQIKTSVL